MHNDHLAKHIHHDRDFVSDSTLHVVGVVSNSARYQSRYRLFREWEKQMLATANVKLHLVELSFGDRKHEVTEDAAGDSGRSVLQLRSGHELWHKENLINLGVRHLLPRDWKYMAWIDADVSFGNTDWASETIHALQHHHVVQPWTQCVDLGASGNVSRMFQSFTGLVSDGLKPQARKDEPYPYGHPGFAWACTRTFFENVSGLMEHAVLGSGDHYMAWALMNQVDRVVPSGMSDAYKRACRQWQLRAFQLTEGLIGTVPGRIEHQFHGPKARRYYRERWQILVDHGFDPDLDLRRDHQGLIYLVGKPKLREAVHRYMKSRHEDSIEDV